MTDSHNHSFFGQNTGLLVNSTSKSESFIFMRCIKRKTDNSWEKPSKGEGKVIKFSMEELVMILQVLNREVLNWTSYHTFKDNKTPISFSWEDKEAKTLWINIANYSKMLNYAQAEILRLLITHILSEKIKYATTSDSSIKTSKNIKNNANQGNFNPKAEETKVFKEFPEENQSSFMEEINEQPVNNKNVKISTPQDKILKDKKNIEGSIKGETQKALLIDFKSGEEIWIPKSTIHSEYTPRKNFSQSFLIDSWILKKNKIIA